MSKKSHQGERLGHPATRVHDIPSILNTPPPRKTAPSQNSTASCLYRKCSLKPYGKSGEHENEGCPSRKRDRYSKPGRKEDFPPPSLKGASKPPTEPLRFPLQAALGSKQVWGRSSSIFVVEDRPPPLRLPDVSP